MNKVNSDLFNTEFLRTLNMLPHVENDQERILIINVSHFYCPCSTAS